MPVDASNALLCWYAVDKRRCRGGPRAGERPDPYRVWLSEIMLQQTTVAHAAALFRDLHRALADRRGAGRGGRGGGDGRLGGARLLCPRPQPARLRPHGRRRAWRPLPRRGGGACASCRASAPIPPRRSPRSPSAGARWWSTPMSSGSSRGCSRSKRRCPRRGDEIYRARRIDSRPSASAGRLRPGDDGPRRDDLHAALARLRPLPARLALLRRARERRSASLSGQGGQGAQAAARGHRLLARA